MTSPIRIAILGCGGIARAHARAATAEGAVITAAASRDAKSATAFLAEHGAPGARAWTDPRAMVAAADADVLAVCLPPGAHDGVEEEAAARGMHLFLEKPIALDPARGASIAAAVSRAGVACQIGFQYRTTAPIAELRARIADGRAGEPSLFTGRYWCNALHPAWWRDPAVGGGQMVEQAIHLYDLALHLLGPAVSVSALCGNLGHRDRTDYRVDDTSGALVGFRDGAMAVIAASNCAVPGAWQPSFSVVCRNLSAEFTAPESGRIVTTGGRPAEQLAPGESCPVEHPAMGENPTRLLWRDLIRAVRQGGTTIAPISCGLDSLRLVAAAAASARQGGIRIGLDDGAALQARSG